MWNNDHPEQISHWSVHLFLFFSLTEMINCLKGVSKGYFMLWPKWIEIFFLFSLSFVSFPIFPHNLEWLTLCSLQSLTMLALQSEGVKRRMGALTKLYFCATCGPHLQSSGEHLSALSQFVSLFEFWDEGNSRGQINHKMLTCWWR